MLVDERIERPEALELHLRRWPWRRLRIRGLGGDGVVVGAADGDLGLVMAETSLGASEAPGDGGGSGGG